MQQFSWLLLTTVLVLLPQSCIRPTGFPMPLGIMGPVRNTPLIRRCNIVPRYLRGEP